VDETYLFVFTTTEWTQEKLSIEASDYRSETGISSDKANPSLGNEPLLEQLFFETALRMAEIRAKGFEVCRVSSSLQTQSANRDVVHPWSCVRDVPAILSHFQKKTFSRCGVSLRRR
jgi:hypothetical protein